MELDGVCERLGISADMADQWLSRKQIELENPEQPTERDVFALALMKTLSENPLTSRYAADVLKAHFKGIGEFNWIAITVQPDSVVPFSWRGSTSDRPSEGPSSVVIDVAALRAKASAAIR